MASRRPVAVIRQHPPQTQRVYCFLFSFAFSNDDQLNSSIAVLDGFIAPFGKALRTVPSAAAAASLSITLHKDGTATQVSPSAAMFCRSFYKP